MFLKSCHCCRGWADVSEQTTFDISHETRPPARLSRPWNPFELETASTSDFWKNIHQMSLNATTFENCSSSTCEISSNKSVGDATLDQLKTSANTPAEGDDAPPVLTLLPLVKAQPRLRKEPFPSEASTDQPVRRTTFSVDHFFRAYTRM